MGLFRDLTGERYGRLTVQAVGLKTKSGNYKWICLCDCGAEKVLPADHLLRKVQPVQSCGCYRDDRIRETCSPDPNGTAFRLLLGVYKKRSRLKGIEFGLTEEEFRNLTSCDCHYCGAPPEMVIENRPRSGRYVYSSIDRKDPNDGYTPDNSVSCCKSCNYMKWTFSEAEFLERVKAIAKKAGF